LREAGTALVSEAQLADDRDALRELRAAGRAVRVSGRLYAHADVVAEIEERIVALIEREGPATLAGVRDALGISRRSAQAFLEHLDAQRVTRRLPDDRRVLVRAREGIS
jgi:selenocysteine-specific elongation factor